ncbi:MAG: hypothetical protein QXL77_08445 [Candidatus Bathyarchaeia archaeon]
MTERWRFNPQEREQLRNLIGKIIIGPEYQSQRPILEQVREQLGGPIIGQRLQALGFSNPAPQEKPREEIPMPPDYWNPTEWERLDIETKKKIAEALKAGRKTYISRYVEESKRALLDGPVSQELKLKKLLGS